MRTQTLLICSQCGHRIEYDNEINAYLRHDHQDTILAEEEMNPANDLSDVMPLRG